MSVQMIASSSLVSTALYTYLLGTTCLPNGTDVQPTLGSGNDISVTATTTVCRRSPSLTQLSTRAPTSVEWRGCWGTWCPGQWICCLQVSAGVVIVVHRVTQSMECYALCVLHSEIPSLSKMINVEMPHCNVPPLLHNCSTTSSFSV